MGICSAGTNRTAPSPAPSMTGILHQIAVLALLANVVFFVVAVALGGVEGDFGVAAGALVALVVFGDGRDGPGHARSPVAWGITRGAPGAFRHPLPPFINIKFFELRG